MIELNVSVKNLTTLEGQNIPKKIDMSFLCQRNLLTSLEFGPEEVTGNFDCAQNKLTSLKFGPEKVMSGYYNCEDNKLTSLEFCPSKLDSSFFCTANKIKSLEFGPSKVNGNYYAISNKISNLKNIHKHFKNGYIRGELLLGKNPLKSHLLGIILIPELQGFTFDEMDLSKILNKHIQENRDVLDCQEELIQNNFKEFAQL